MNRGVEIDSVIADDIEVSVIQEQVEMGVAIRMAVLDALARGLAAARAERAMTGKRTAFVNARLIDPAIAPRCAGRVAGRRRQDRRFRRRGCSTTRKPADAEIVDCKGLVLAPGLIDMRVFTGEPGSEHRETLASASQAAAAGGVTTIVVMPNTDPIIDEPSLVDFIKRRAAATASVRVLPMAALTRDLAGEMMTEIGLLMEAGAIAFTDGDRTIANAPRDAPRARLRLDLRRAGGWPCRRSRNLSEGRRHERRRIRHPARPSRGARRWPKPSSSSATSASWS